MAENSSYCVDWCDSPTWPTLHQGKAQQLQKCSKRLLGSQQGMQVRVEMAVVVRQCTSSSEFVEVSIHFDGTCL